MIKTNEYYTIVYERNNRLKERFLSFFFDISSYPRLLLEVFIRRDMGRRYFSLSHCIGWGIIFLFLPFLLPANHGQAWHEIVLDHWGWYLYLVAFGIFSRKRYLECKFPWGYFDFDHFTKYTGTRLPQVNNFTFKGKAVNVRSLDVYVEPLLMTAVGLLAFSLGQGLLGGLLTICAGVYSLSYRAAYQMGQDFVLDKIDKAIANGWYTGTFLNGSPQTSNFNFYGPKPSSSDIRNGLADLFRDDDDGTDVR